MHCFIGKNIIITSLHVAKFNLLQLFHKVNVCKQSLFDLKKNIPGHYDFNSMVCSLQSFSSWSSCGDFQKLVTTALNKLVIQDF